MTRLDLPDGAWAELADPTRVQHRKRRPVRRVMFELVQLRAAKPSSGTFADVDNRELDLLEDLSDFLVLALVTEWSFPYAIDADGLGELPGPAYDALQEACSPLSKDLLPSFEVHPDPKSPQTTTNLSESKPLSRVDGSTSPTSMSALMS